MRRVQVTNSSPANPQSLRSRSQSAQVTAGAGYSLHGGLHIGVSGFRGPYLDHVVAAFLPTGKSLTGFLLRDSAGMLNGPEDRGH